MELLLSFVGGLVLAAFGAVLVLRSVKSSAAEEKEKAIADAQRQSAIEQQAAVAKLKADLEHTQQNLQKMQSDKDKADTRIADLNREVTDLTAQLTSAKTELEVHLTNEQRNAQERTQRDNEAKQEREQQAKEQLKLLSEAFEATSQRVLKERAEDLGKTNTEKFNTLLNPVMLQMKEVKDLMDKTRSTSDTNKASLEQKIEEMLKQTDKISKDANNLADALKNRGKVHGDWGEQVLEDILIGSGLRADIEYSCQASFKGEHGNELRPDVVVNCADGKRIIVDSKVSLTAYTDALGAATEEEREVAVRRNCESVKRHVRELADKQYPKYVEGSMNYVLMFIPNEGAYVMAMNYDRSLAQEAFRNGVIIVNPTNLMLTLHLVLQTWQETRQEDNCKKILDAANKMYDKMVGLVDTCRTLGAQLDTANNTYHKAMNQLCEGTGNVLRRVEELKEFGITSTKRPRVRKVTTSSEQTALPTEDAAPMSQEEQTLNE